MNVVGLTADLEQLVMKALETPYSSFSATDESETGNRYQAVGLGDRSTRGLREDRGRFLDVLDLRGRKVLDLGSNLGEISRAARARGAALVDGFEIDPYFNEIADLVNALTGTTGVSFYERDLADPSVYRERYDVVLAFSAFRFIAGCLDRIAAITDVLLVETHELKGNFEERYLDALRERFPAWRMLGDSDVERLRAGGVRAVALFARHESMLTGALAPHLRDGGRAAGAVAAGVRGERIRGATEELELGGGRVRIAGWCRDAVTPHDAVELSTPGFGTLAVSEPAADGGFEFDCEAPLAADGPVRLDVSAFSGATPLGTMSAWATPGQPGAPGLTVTHELLEPLGRYRALSSFGSILLWQEGSAPLEAFVRSLLPTARMSAVPADGPFDLVVGHAADADRIEELHGLVEPRGYVALAVAGELARRFGEPGIGRDDLIRRFAAQFDVMTYVEGGVSGLYDLILLRRP
jgi:SAM-dependent methyltransferase